MNAAIRAAAACMVFAAACLTAPAMAQTTFQQQERQAPDENGVDVISGRISVPLRSVSVGQGDSALTYAAGWADGRLFDSFSVLVSGVTGQAAVVTIFGEAKRFSKNGDGSWANLDADGATFATTGTGYVYTARDGTVFTFLNSLGDTGWGALTPARVSTIRRPDGETLTYHHRLQAGSQSCDPQFNCSFAPAGGRVQSVTSNLGYQLKATYASDSWNTNGDNADFHQLTNVRAINNAVDYCAPAADTCTGFTQSWPELSVSVSTSGGTSGWTFTDLLGNATTVTESADGVISVTSPADAAQDLAITYDGNGRVATLSKGGGTWGYSYADAVVNGVNQRTTTVTQPIAGSRVYVSNRDTRRLLSVTDELNRITSFQHDSNGRVTQITRPEGNSIGYTYDARGNVTETRLREKGDTGDTADDIVTSAAFPATCTNAVTCNRPTTTTDPRGHVTDYTYDSTHGGLLAVTSPAPSGGATRPQIRYSYAQHSAWYRNSAGNIVQAPSAVYRLSAVSSCMTGSAPACLGTPNETRTTLDRGTGSSTSANNLLVRTVSSGAGDASLTATSAYAYDPVGNVTGIDGPLAGTADTTGFRYDALRRRIMVVSPDPDGGGSLPHRAVLTEYDEDGNVTVVLPGTTSTLTGSFVTPLSGERAMYDYDSLGRRTRASVASGFAPPLGGITVHQLVQTSYDIRGRIECTAQRMNPAELATPPASACEHDTASQTYGPDRITRNFYDSANQLTKVQTGYGVTGVQADEVTATYTPNGRAMTVTDAEGNRTTYEYDVHDRLLNTRFPSPTTPGVSAPTSGVGADYEQPTYDAAGNVATLRLRDGQSIAFSYDNLNRLTLKNVPNVVYAEHDVSYSYDNFSRPTLLSGTNGHSIAFAYDVLGRVTSETGNYGAKTLEYDLAGRMIRMSWPDGVTIAYDYNVTGEVTTIRENPAGTPFTLATYTYDEFGRRESLSRGNGTVTTYDYDVVSRLEQLVQQLAGTTSDLTLDFTHDPAGQIHTAARDNDAFSFLPANANITDSINGLNQVTQTGATNVSHDGRGNISAIGTGAFTYTSENRLATRTNPSAWIGYDALGRLLSTSGPTYTIFEHVGDRLVTERANVTFAVVRRYVHGPGVDEPLVWYEGSGTSTRRWFHADERGSIVAVSDQNGNLVGTRNRYDEYGVPQGTLTGRFGFTGQAWGPELGLYYYRARIYNPALGRFMQTDPIGYGSGMNLYAYVGNDPVNFRDPSGLCTLLASNIWNIFNLAGEKLGEKPGPWFSALGPDCYFGAAPTLYRVQFGPTPHFYGVINIVATTEQCTEQEVLEGLVRHGVPEQDVNRPITTTPQDFPVYMPLTSLEVGRVSAQLMPNGMIRNTTLPGHPFFHGTVDRGVESIGPFWLVGTVSQGLNFGGVGNALLNQVLGPQVFNRLDQQLSDYLTVNCRR